MTYPASLLITRSWYLSGIVARDLETVSGNEITDGLFLLNGLLDFSAFDVSLIPYYQQSSFTATSGLGKYFIPNVVNIELITFLLDGTLIPSNSMTRLQFFNQAKPQVLISVPISYYAERGFENDQSGMHINFYPQPDKNYEMNYSGKLGLTDVSLGTDLETVYDNAFILYLMYSLAIYICEWRQASVPPAVYEKFKYFEKKLKYIDPPDLARISRFSYRGSAGFNWADANLGKGWRPIS